MSHRQRPAFVTEEYILEQRKLREERKAKKRKQNPTNEDEETFNTGFIKRPLLRIPHGPLHRGGMHVTVMTYNVLAQNLIRRELFSHSKDAVKWKNRSKVLANELSHYQPDVLCCQEVDFGKLEPFWKPTLENLGYDWQFLRGKHKVHGLLIAWKRDKFRLCRRIDIDLDSGSSRPPPQRDTRNVGMLLGLEFCDMPAHGFVVSTCHLFWHPEVCTWHERSPCVDHKGSYERLRQAGIMGMEAARLSEHLQWPCILAGDFNSTPDDCAYLALTSRPITMNSKSRKYAEDSMLYDFQSRYADDEDEIVGADGSDAGNDIGDYVLRVDTPDEEAKLNGRELFTVDQLLDFHASQPAVYRSCYGHAYHKVHPQNCDSVYNEPWFSNWASRWQGLLDYILLLDRHASRKEDEIVNGVTVTELLRLPEKQEMGQGEPQEGRYPSDHISLMAKLYIEY